MQEYIINGLLVVVALLAVILQIIARGLRRYDQKTKSDVVADSDCYGSTVDFAGPGRRRI